MRYVTALAVLPLLGACSLLVATDELAASGPIAEAGAPEAGPDSTAPLEGGSEPALDAEAGTPGFCEEHPATFCADFSDSSRAEDGWSSVDRLGGDLGLGMAGSAPPALEASLSPGTGDRAARLLRDFPSVPSEIHLELKMFVGVANARFREFVKIEFPTTHEQAAPGRGSSGLMLQTVDDELALRVEAFDASGAPFSTNHVAGARLSFGKWVHVALGAVLSPTNGSVELKLDGAVVLSKSGIPTVGDGLVAARLAVGAFAYDLTEPASDLFDDILFDAKP